MSALSSLLGSTPGTIPAGQSGALPQSWYRDSRDQSAAVAPHPALAMFPEYSPQDALSAYNGMGNRATPAPASPAAPQGNNTFGAVEALLRSQTGK